MKKYLLIFYYLLILLSVNAQVLPTKPRTLNGIDAVIATTQMTYFKNNKNLDLSPKKTSIWFGKDEIHFMVALLRSEIDSQKKRGIKTDTTDGIRIYFLGSEVPGSTTLEN